MKALVVYASETGRTQRVAAAVADGAREAGAEVELLAARDAGEEALLAADAIALGSAVHMGSLASEMGAKNAVFQADEVLADFLSESLADSGGIWADPDAELVYVFLSNRTFPSATNRLLVKSELRTRIQKAIYDAILN